MAKYECSAVAAVAGFAVIGDDLDDDLAERSPSLDIEPWPEPVGGIELLDEIESHLRRYIWLSDAASTAVTLWIVLTHAIEAAQFAPRLLMTSPLPDCGKSLVLDFLSCVVRRPDQSGGESASTLFRTIHETRPTLLIDENDELLVSSREIVRVLNVGHKRRGAIIKKTEMAAGQRNVRRFNVFGSVALAWKGVLPARFAALESRCIRIGMQKKPGTAELADLIFHGDRGPAALYHVARRAARWTADMFDVLAEARPKIPGISNRAADNWRMLVAIADAAGGGWPQRAREAAVVLTAVAAKSSEEVLLGDIKAIFTVPRLRSVELVRQLANIEEHPWSDLSPSELAAKLAPFGIAPKNIRFGREVAKGYERRQFEAAFAAYVPDGTATAATEAEPEPESCRSPKPSPAGDKATPGGAHFSAPMPSHLGDVPGERARKLRRGLPDDVRVIGTGDIWYVARWALNDTGTYDWIRLSDHADRKQAEASAKELRAKIAADKAGF